MDLLSKLGFLLPLLPLFLIPLVLVVAAWADRRRHAGRGRGPRAADGSGGSLPPPR